MSIASSQAKLQITKFDSSQKHLEHVQMFHYGQNSIGTLVGSPEFINLGVMYSYHAC
jgi:hypothetical protein